MPVKLAKKVGFCFGVKRAVTMAEEVIKNEKHAYSLGSLIHNRQVVRALSGRGLKVINDINKVKSGCCIVISSHGISPRKAQEIRKRSLKLVDTTCPFVRNAQDMARRLSNEGYRIIIVGDANHPEVRALVDFARFARRIRYSQTKANFAGKEVAVVKNAAGIKALHLGKKDKVGVFSQTTQAMNNFLAVVRAVIKAKPAGLRVFNTICRDAEDRQAAAKDLARNVDVMLIAGGKNSANTKRLLSVCKKILKNSYLIETKKDMKDAWFKKARVIGITSGASTPDWIVKSVAQAVESKLKIKSKIHRSTKANKR
jgi:(E)-4-hydroxy-3-methyl-but-2-enyl pyrophosphate reductase